MIQRIILIVLVAVVSAYAGYLMHISLGHRAERECRAAHALVNGSVACGEKDIIRKTGYIETRNEIARLIDEKRADGMIRETAVYFRDLVHGPVFGINELEDFAPASLLKLPLAIVYLAVADDAPDLLDVTLGYTGTSSVPDQYISPQESAQPGVSYSLRELLRLMLTYSDNAAYETLEAYIADSEERALVRRKVFQELGVIDPKDRIETTLTVRGYSSLFRILYNASYLDVTNSQMVLQWLSASPYKDGLVKGVPGDVTVAHKFGERTMPDGTKELHDCGIVYYPGNPYLLCVMTRGTDWDAQTALIAEISRRVYAEVASRAL